MMKAKIIYIVWLFIMIATAGLEATAATAKATISSRKIISTPSRTDLDQKISIFERASANRELAAITQMEQVGELKKQVVTLGQSSYSAEDSNVNTYKKIGSIEKKAAILYGAAAANYDKAAANRHQVVLLSTTLGNVEKKRNTQAYATNLKAQGSEAIRLASTACERAAEAYEKANDNAGVVAASQQAAAWLEKLALR